MTTAIVAGCVLALVAGLIWRLVEARKVAAVEKHRGGVLRANQEAAHRAEKILDDPPKTLAERRARARARRRLRRRRSA